MFGNSKEYQDIQKLYTEKVSKPEQLDEKPKNPLDLSGALNRVKQTGAKNPLELSMPSTIKKDTTPPPETKTETPPPSPRLKADITTNQRQSRALAADDKNVKLNKFSRTQRYAADAKGVKLVPGAKVGQTVNRSTVQTRAAFDFGGIKKGERLGVMTRNQRRKYDLMAAQRAKDTTPPPEKKTTTPPPEEKKVTTQPEKKTEKKIFTASDMMSGKKPTSDNKGFENVDKKNTEKKSGNILDKSGLPSRRSFIPLNQKDAKPMGRSAAKRRKMAASQTNTNTGKVIPKPNTGTDTEGNTNKIIPKRNTGTDTEGTRKQIPQRNTGTDTKTNTQIKRFPGSGKEIDPRAKVTQTTSTNDKGQKVTTTTTKTSLQGSDAAEAIRKNREERKRRMEKANSVNKEGYEPYDIVLEYLLSTQQVATIEEANYVMTEMDAKTIQDIISEADYFGVPKNIRDANKRLSGPGPHSTKDKKDVLLYYGREKKGKV